jgi:hypothetical protein
MATKDFLNVYIKIALCLLGMGLMAYFIYPSVQAGEFSDHLTIVRVLVFLGFSYLLVQSVRKLL